MYVPTRTSIMRGNLEIPAFNPVERRRIDEVMAIFESSQKQGYSNLPIIEQSQEIEQESIKEYQRWHKRLGVVEKGEDDSIREDMSDDSLFWFVGLGVLVIVILTTVIVLILKNKQK